MLMGSTLDRVIAGAIAMLIFGTVAAILVIQSIQRIPLTAPPFLPEAGGVVLGYFFSHQAANAAAIGITNGLIASKGPAVPGQVTTTTNPVDGGHNG